MSEERRQVHPQEPAEGSQGDVEAPGASGSPDDMGTGSEGSSAEERSQEHPQEPAEGGGEEVDAPGADRPSDNS
jgi:hypothetical protein